MAQRGSFTASLIITMLGIYVVLTLSHHRERGLSLGKRRLTHPAGNGPRILTYITTHLSVQHYDFLQHCWPHLLANLPLFQKSHFMMFVTRNREDSVDIDLINAVFARTRVTIKVMSNPGYQLGATMALTEAFKNNVFAGYDWVIRVNPDVLIRNDTFILARMNDPDISGIFDDCLDMPCPAGRRCADRLIHTDFLAIRPDAISPDDLVKALQSNGDSSERMLTEAFSDIVERGADSWLPGTGPHHGECRVVGESSPVIHDHSMLRTCAGALGDHNLQ